MVEMIQAFNGDKHARTHTSKYYLKIHQWIHQKHYFDTEHKVGIHTEWDTR